MNTIKISNLSCCFNNRFVLRNVNLSVKRGSFVTIIGPFGSGKTTLLKIIAGLIDFHEGQVAINNQPPYVLRNNNKIGFSFQKPNLLPWRNVIANLTLPQEITGSPYNPKRAFELLDMINQRKLAKKKVNELSGGMQQIVSILRSLILDPDILLLDEPFSSIDEISRDILHEQLLNIHNLSGKTTIMVTHSLQEAIYLSDKVIVLGGHPSSIVHIEHIRRSNTYDLHDKYSEDLLYYAKKLKEKLK